MSAQQWVGGQRASADRLSNMLHKMHDFTPDWNTTSGANFPDYGNAVIDCRYSQSGDLVVAHYDITFGSTTNFGGGAGSDNYQFSLPVQARSAPVGGVVMQSVGDFHIYTVAAGAKLTCRARLFDTGNVIIEITNNRADSGAIANTGLVDAISPFVWASGSSVKGVIEYEAS
jgi:hypothetical protein